jgi:hypothetical protein
MKQKNLLKRIGFVVNYNNYVNDNTYTKSSVDYKDNKVLQKMVDIM